MKVLKIIAIAIVEIVIVIAIGKTITIVVATVAWVASTDDASNELGAEHGFETIAPLNNKIFFLENESGDDWTNVRIVLNGDYLYTVDKVPEGNRVMLRPEDGRLVEFDYSNRKASYLGANLTSGGTVKAVDANTGEVTLELFIKDEDGDVTTPGSAVVRFGK